MGLRFPTSQANRISTSGLKVILSALSSFYINRIAASDAIPTSLRWRLLRIAGLELLKCRVAGKNFFGSRKIKIGQDCFINRECLFDGSDDIVLDSGVSVGMRVMFITSSHSSDDPRRRAGKAVSKPIFVGSGAWIGAGAMILPGVSIGRGSIIAAGAVVTGDCSPHTLYAGIPARPVRTLAASEMK